MFYLYGCQTGSNASCLIISCCLQVRHANISQNFAVTLLKALLLFTVFSIFDNGHLPFFNKSICSCIVKVALLPVQPLVDRVLQCLVLVVSSQGCLSESKGENSMVLSQDSRVGMAAISIQILLWSLWYVHLWVTWHCHWENSTSDTFLVFIPAARVSCHIARLVI